MFLHIQMLLLKVDTLTICMFLHTSGLTHQKLVAKHKEEFIHRQSFWDVLAEMLMFLDETGADQRKC